MSDTPIHRDFTFDKYRQLCETLASAGYALLTFSQLRDRSPEAQPAVMLRHDVDRSLSKALDMAAYEARRGIRATYFVRMIPAVFQPERIRELHRLGHEVGYHYEVLTKTKGNVALALELFEKELARLRRVAPVHSASMHGSPLSPWNSLNIWKECGIGRFDITTEASLSVDYSGVYYFTDTGRCWSADRFNIRDRVNSPSPGRRIETTDDLIAFLAAGSPLPIIINTHPNRWAQTSFDYQVTRVLDHSANWAKWLIAGFWRLRHQRNNR